MFKKELLDKIDNNHSSNNNNILRNECDYNYYILKFVGEEQEKKNQKLAMTTGFCINTQTQFLCIIYSKVTWNSADFVTILAFFQILPFLKKYLSLRLEVIFNIICFHILFEKTHKTNISCLFTIFPSCYSYQLNYYQQWHDYLKNVQLLSVSYYFISLLSFLFFLSHCLLLLYNYYYVKFVFLKKNKFILLIVCANTCFSWFSGPILNQGGIQYYLKFSLSFLFPPHF